MSKRTEVVRHEVQYLDASLQDYYLLNLQKVQGAELRSPLVIPASKPFTDNGAFSSLLLRAIKVLGEAPLWDNLRIPFLSFNMFYPERLKSS